MQALLSTPTWRCGIRAQQASKQRFNIRRPTASSGVTAMTVDGPADQQLPATYKRLVAKRTGDCFKDVAEVEEVPMPQLGPNEASTLG